MIEAPPAAPTSTQVVRTSGAIAWWQRRQRFLQLAKERGLTRNPIVPRSRPEEALDLVALTLCQAIFHDLEKSTGVNVWTFAQNLAGGWFERGGEWAPLRDLIDILGDERAHGRRRDPRGRTRSSASCSTSRSAARSSSRSSRSAACSPSACARSTPS